MIAMFLMGLFLGAEITLDFSYATDMSVEYVELLKEKGEKFECEKSNYTQLSQCRPYYWLWDRILSCYRYVRGHLYMHSVYDVRSSISQYFKCYKGYKSSALNQTLVYTCRCSCGVLPSAY